MFRLLIVGLVVTLLSACQTRDEHFYRVNPKALQEAIENCPAEQPSGLTCDQINVIVNEVNLLATELHRNRQAFGQKIIALQTELANLQLELKKSPGKAEIVKSIDSINLQLAMRLAIVKWLESPESK